MKKYILMFLIGASITSAQSQNIFSCQEMLKFSNYYKKLRLSQDKKTTQEEFVSSAIETVFKLRSKRGSFRLRDEKVPVSLVAKIKVEEKKLKKIKKKYEKEICKDYVPKCMNLFSHDFTSRKSKAKELDFPTLKRAFNSCRGLCPSVVKKLTSYNTKNGGTIEGVLNSRFSKKYTNKIDKKYLTKWPSQLVFNAIKSTRGNKYCPRPKEIKCIPEGEAVKTSANGLSCCTGLALDKSYKSSQIKGICVDSGLIQRAEVYSSEGNEKGIFLNSKQKTKSESDSVKSK